MNGHEYTSVAMEETTTFSTVQSCLRKEIVLHIVAFVVATIYIAAAFVFASWPHPFIIYAYIVYLLYECQHWNLYDRIIRRFIIDIILDIFEENIYRDLLTATVTFVNIGFIAYQCACDPTHLYPLCSSVGLIAICLICNFRNRLHWSPIVRAFNAHYALALLFVYLPYGRKFIIDIGQGIVRYLKFSEIGARFTYGHMLIDQFVFAFYVLASLYLSLMTIAILRHIGFLDYLVGISQKFAFCIGVAPIEGVFGFLNIFMSMTETCVIVRDCLQKMTQPQIFSLLVTGLSTVSITALFGYVSLGADIDYLIVSSIMAIPCSFALSKIFYPDTVPNEYSRRNPLRRIRNLSNLEAGGDDEDGYVVMPEIKTLWDKCSESIIEATFVIQVIIGNLIALMSLVGAVDYMVSLFLTPFTTTPPGIVDILSIGVAYIMPLFGIDPYDARMSAEMLVNKVLVNEFSAFQLLGKNLNKFTSHRSVAIMNVMLCGFGNISASGMLSSMISSLTEKRVKTTGILIKALIVAIIVNIYCACTISILID